MGEDVNNYEEIIFDDDEDDDEYEENEDEYDMEEPETHCHHSMNNDGDLIVEHRLECGARVVHCCEKHHHHECQGTAVELNQVNHNGKMENDKLISRERNGADTSRNCSNDVSEDILVENSRAIEFSAPHKPCITSSTSSSSDEFLELPFNDLSVSSGMYGAARNECHINSNATSITLNSGLNKRR